MKGIKRYFFAWRFRRAVRKANELSELFRLKYYVIVFNGKLKVIPKKTIRELIRLKKTPKGVTAADFERRALYVAIPPVERRAKDNSKRIPMFLTDEDYAVVIGEDALKVVSRASEINRLNAEREAIEEISGYLRPVYDCKTIFAASGAERNSLIVMRAADIALYHLVASLPQKMGIEIRKERYERAIEWLEGIQSGKIIPDLPLMVDEKGEPASSPTVFSLITN